MEYQNFQNDKKEALKKRKSLILIISAVILIIAAIIFFYFFVSPRKENKPSENPRVERSISPNLAAAPKVPPNLASETAGFVKGGIIKFTQNTEQWFGKLIERFTLADTSKLTGNLSSAAAGGSDVFVVRQGDKILQISSLNQVVDEKAGKTLGDLVGDHVRKVNNMDILVQPGEMDAAYRTLVDTYGENAVRKGTTYNDGSQQVFIDFKSMFPGEKKGNILDNVKDLIYSGTDKPINKLPENFEVTLQQSKGYLKDDLQRTVDLYSEIPHPYGDLTKPGGQLSINPEEMTTLKDIATQRSRLLDDSDSALLQRLHDQGTIKSPDAQGAFDFLYQKVGETIHPEDRAALRIANMKEPANGWFESNGVLSDYFNTAKSDKLKENFISDVSEASYYGSDRKAILDKAESFINKDFEFMINNGDITGAQKRLEIMQRAIDQDALHPDIKSLYEKMVPELRNQVEQADKDKFVEKIASGVTTGGAVASEEVSQFYKNLFKDEQAAVDNTSESPQQAAGETAKPLATAKEVDSMVYNKLYGEVEDYKNSLIDQVPNQYQDFFRKYMENNPAPGNVPSDYNENILNQMNFNSPEEREQLRTAMANWDNAISIQEGLTNANYFPTNSYYIPQFLYPQTETEALGFFGSMATPGLFGISSGWLGAAAMMGADMAIQKIINYPSDKIIEQQRGENSPKIQDLNTEASKLLALKTSLQNYELGKVSLSEDEVKQLKQDIQNSSNRISEIEKSIRSEQSLSGKDSGTVYNDFIPPETGREAASTTPDIEPAAQQPFQAEGIGAANLGQGGKAITGVYNPTEVQNLKEQNLINNFEKWLGDSNSPALKGAYQDLKGLAADTAGKQDANVSIPLDNAQISNFRQVAQEAGISSSTVNDLMLSTFSQAQQNKINPGLLDNFESSLKTDDSLKEISDAYNKYKEATLGLVQSGVLAKSASENLSGEESQLMTDQFKARQEFMNLAKDMNIDSKVTDQVNSYFDRLLSANSNPDRNIAGDLLQRATTPDSGPAQPASTQPRADISQNIVASTEDTKANYTLNEEANQKYRDGAIAGNELFLQKLRYDLAEKGGKDPVIEAEIARVEKENEILKKETEWNKQLVSLDSQIEEINNKLGSLDPNNPENEVERASLLSQGKLLALETDELFEKIRNSEWDRNIGELDRRITEAQGDEKNTLQILRDQYASNWYQDSKLRSENSLTRYDPDNPEEAEVIKKYQDTIRSAEEEVKKLEIKSATDSGEVNTGRGVENEEGEVIQTEKVIASKDEPVQEGGWWDSFKDRVSGAWDSVAGFFGGGETPTNDQKVAIVGPDPITSSENLDPSSTSRKPQSEQPIFAPGEKEAAQEEAEKARQEVPATPHDQSWRTANNAEPQTIIDSGPIESVDSSYGSRAPEKDILASGESSFWKSYVQDPYAKVKEILFPDSYHDIIRGNRAEGTEPISPIAQLNPSGTQEQSQVNDNNPAKDEPYTPSPLAPGEQSDYSGVDGNGSSGSPYAPKTDEKGNLNEKGEALMDKLYEIDENGDVRLKDNYKETLKNYKGYFKLPSKEKYIEYLAKNNRISDDQWREVMSKGKAVVLPNGTTIDSKNRQFTAEEKPDPKNPSQINNTVNPDDVTIVNN